MNSATANEGKGKTKIFETILCSPGMNEKCKLVLQVTRQQILLVGRLIECGLFSQTNAFSDDIIGALPKDALEEMKELQEEILEKGNLTEFYERIKAL